MGTNTVNESTTGSVSVWKGLFGRRRARRMLFGWAESVVGLGSIGVVSAQEAGSGAGGGVGPGLYVTVAALAFSGLAIAAVYLFSWRDRPEQTFTPATPTEDTVPNRHTGQMYEAAVASSETESVDHDAFDPVGTGLLLVMYFVVIALMWLFMYFVEFLGNGPQVVG